MAAGKMSWQYNQKHLPTYGLSGTSDGAGDMQDMHLKMSKKIAQLTKVIYALNTKNDEHEAAMSALKDAHEEEMQQLLSETSTKIQQYRLKIGNELDLRRKIRNLEECVTAFEKEKKQAMVEMDAHEQILAERQVDKEREYEQKMHQLTKELLETKAAFEQRLSDFEHHVATLENEKSKNMNSLTGDYKKQVDELRLQLINQQSNAIEEKKQLKNEHGAAVKQFENEILRLEKELIKLVEESEAKLDKAKAFYEHELVVVRSSSVSSDEMATKWLERETALKQEAAKIEMSLKNKMKEISNELEIQREEVKDLMMQLTKSKSEANSTLDHIKDLRDQLSKLQQENVSSANRTKMLEEDLNREKKSNEAQANDLLRKTNIIGTLEAIKVTQEESIRGLEDQLREFKRRLMEVENEKVALLSSKSNENGELMNQLKIMSKKVETLNEEKSSMQKQFKRDLEEIKMSHDDETEKLKQQFEKEADSMVRGHQAEIEVMKNEAKEAMDKMLTEMEERLRREAGLLESEKFAAVARVEREKEAVEISLQHAQAEINRLNELTERHESGLGDASSHIASLKSRVSELESDVMAAETRHKSAEAVIVQLRAELTDVNDGNERRVARLNRDHEMAIEKVKRECDEKWEEEMRNKLTELEHRLNSQLGDDRLEALQELEDRKNKEMESLKSGWEEQIKQLSGQISELNMAMEAERLDFDRKLEASKADVTIAERKLRREAEAAASDHVTKMNHLQECHEMELATLERKKEDELKMLETRLMSQHREEMHSQMRSQQVAIESVRDKINREKREEMENRQQEFHQDMDELRSELTHHHAMALDDVKRQYEHQLAAAKTELEQLIESKSRNDEKLSQKIADLETDIRLTTSESNKTRDKIAEQNEMLAALNKEIDQKGHEILRVRSEANMELRRREEELNRRFQSSQDKREAEFIRQKQTMVHEFNKAAEVLKDKISALNIALYQAEEKYERRESRAEDLDAINQLKALVREREEQMQKLIDDKKFYQMELVNRETNFNKVFTSAPNVGVLDPRSKKKKGATNSSAPPRFTSQFVSVPNLNSIETALNGTNRLEPLRAGSNSPIGYSNKHLQPTPPSQPKKFLR